MGLGAPDLKKLLLCQQVVVVDEGFSYARLLKELCTERGCAGLGWEEVQVIGLTLQQLCGFLGILMPAALYSMKLTKLKVPSRGSKEMGTESCE